MSTHVLVVTGLDRKKMDSLLFSIEGTLPACFEEPRKGAWMKKARIRNVMTSSAVQHKGV
jgi:hypothetical protein